MKLELPWLDHNNNFKKIYVEDGSGFKTDEDLKKACNECKFCNLCKFKFNFNNRDDILYYISSDELTKINNMKGPIVLKLTVDTEAKIDTIKHKKGSSPSISPKEKITTRQSRKDSSPIRRRHSHENIEKLTQKRIIHKTGQFIIHYFNNPKTYSLFIINKREEQKKYEMTIRESAGDCDYNLKPVSTFDVKTKDVDKLQSCKIKIEDNGESFDFCIFSADICSCSTPFYIELLNPKTEITSDRLVQTLEKILIVVQNSEEKITQ